MELWKLLQIRGITPYKLSKLTNIPLTTINDLVNDKSDVLKCKTETTYKIAKCLEVPIEDLFLFSNVENDYKTVSQYYKEERVKGGYMKTVNELLKFLNLSHSEYQAVNGLAELLRKNEFEELDEKEIWKLKKGGKYFVIRDESSIISFKVPIDISDPYFLISASHSDSPCFKIKEENDIISSGYNKINAESYGSLILNSWLDKPLSFAGRVIYKKGTKLVSSLVDIDKDLLIIPNTCIHFNSALNDGYKYNKNIDMVPIISMTGEENSVKHIVADTLKIKKEQIVSYDLYLYNRERSVLGGLNDDFVFSPRIDNLESAFLTTKGLVDSKSNVGISVCYVANNEEVGSRTLNGADSDFLFDTLERISSFFKFDLKSAFAKSFILSVDNAHAVHPNHPELSDANSRVALNGGIVIKNNANCAYTTNSISSSVVKTICENSGTPYQIFYNRNDVRGGSTLGAISLSHVSIYSCDIGLSQLAMHSNYEVGGADDIDFMHKFMKKYYETSIIVKKDGIQVK